MSEYTTKFHSGIGGMLLIDPDGKSIPVDVIAERLNTLTAERDAVQREAETLRARVDALKAALSNAQQSLHMLDNHRGNDFEMCNYPTCEDAAALLAPAPQPAPEPEAAPELSEYAKRQISKVNAEKSDERQGKK